MSLYIKLISIKYRNQLFNMLKNKIKHKKLRKWKLNYDNKTILSFITLFILYRNFCFLLGGSIMKVFE